MQYKNHQSLTNLLNSTPELQKLVSKLEHLEQMHHVITSKLDPDLASQCRVANLRDGTLILATTSPAWNHKLRFSALDLLSTLRSDHRWSGLKSIDIRVDYLSQVKTASPTNSKRLKPLSSQASQALTSLAQSISNEKLANSLNKLARRSKN